LQWLASTSSSSILSRSSPSLQSNLLFINIVENHTGRVMNQPPCNRVRRNLDSISTLQCYICSVPLLDLLFSSFLQDWNRIANVTSRSLPSCIDPLQYNKRCAPSLINHRSGFCSFHSIDTSAVL
jgi:hypothetical protein